MPSSFRTLTDAEFPVSGSGDEGWGSYGFVLRTYVSRSMSVDLDRLAAELRLSKSFLVREALRRGLPSLVADVRSLRARGLRPDRHLERAAGPAGSRGVRGDGPVSARWSIVSGRKVGDEPVIPGPPVDED